MRYSVRDVASSPNQCCLPLDAVEKRRKERELVRSADRIQPFRLSCVHGCIVIRRRGFAKRGE